MLVFKFSNAGVDWNLSSSSNNVDIERKNNLKLIELFHEVRFISRLYCDWSCDRLCDGSENGLCDGSCNSIFASNKNHVIGSKKLLLNGEKRIKSFCHFKLMYDDTQWELIAVINDESFVCKKNGTLDECFATILTVLFILYDKFNTVSKS